jgi:L-lactate dehydrogenase (cytochrome)
MTFFFQLYVDKNRTKSEELLRTAERLGAKAVFVTVDGPVQGKREADERVKADRELVSPMSGTRAKNDEKKGNSISRAMGSYIDPTLSWKDVKWLRESTKLPIILKGIMTAQDAVLAMQHGIDGIVLSNHGGRNLDTSPPPMLVLLEIQKNSPEVFDKVEVFVDGGIKRGTDIFKALCLGAKAVGIGRGFLWALNYGEEGVEKFIDILRDELETTMKLCGITDLSQVHPGLVNTLAIDHLVPSGEGHPYAKWRPKARI